MTLLSSRVIFIIGVMPKKGLGGLLPATPSFGMTTTKILRPVLNSITRLRSLLVSSIFFAKDLTLIGTVHVVLFFLRLLAASDAEKKNMLHINRNIR